MIYTDRIHLVADTIGELHAFADYIGLKRCYFEGIKKGHPHYDIPKKFLYIIILAGVEIKRPREILEIAKRLNEQIR